MKITIIISTYNNPKWLEKTLLGYCCQQRMADEIVIADDGSGEETRLLIERYQKLLPIKHVWIEDKGFRKTEILNKALLAATGDYIIFTDQDCIPRADFVKTHEQRARKGYFLSGGYFKLPMHVSCALDREMIEDQRAFSLKFLLANGVKKSFKCTKLFQSPLFARIMNSVTPTRATWNGMNSSGWRTDLLNAGGFDERMKYGGEDRELGERLMNAGIKSNQIRYSAIVLHLDHDRPYVNQHDLQQNILIRRYTKRLRLTRTSHGIK